MTKKLMFFILLSVCLAAGAGASADDQSYLYLLNGTTEQSYLHFMNGLVLERRGEYDTALQEYKNTLKLDPSSVYVHKQALNLALRIGKVNEAEKWAEYVVKKDSSSADNWVLYGNVLWAKNNLNGAQKAYEKAAALDPSDPEAVYQLASLWSSRDQDRSISYLKKYLELKPDDAAETYYQMALLYNAKIARDSKNAGSYQQDLDGVKGNLLKSIAEDQYYLQPRYMLANYYEMVNDTAAAVAQYSDLTPMDPKNTELFDHVGELYAGPAVNDPAGAEKYFLKAWELDKTDPTACFWLAVMSEQKQDFKAAASYLEGSAALKNDPSQVLRLAYYYTQAGGYPRAIALLEKAAAKWPDNGEIAYFLALGYDDTGRTSKALAMLGKIVARHPEDAEARMQYAVISERENDMKTAEENFRYLLKKDPSNANVMNYLGYSLADRGMKLQEAEVLISSAVAKEPNNGAFLDSLAWVRYKRGELPGAEEAMKRAIAVLYDDPEVWGHAGDIYAAAGDYAKAWLCWKNSWLLEKPDKRGAQQKRLKEVAKKLDKAELPKLELEYLKAFSPAGQEFSSFAKLEGKLRGKTIKLDAIVHYSPPSDFSLTVLGPLMAPMWKGAVSGGVMDLDTVSLKGIDPSAFNYWASLMLGELKDWFSGDYLAGAAGWDDPCFSGTLDEVCLADSLAWPDKITPNGERGLKLTPENYFLRDLYLFPGDFVFELPHVSLKITLDRDQMRFSGVNTLKLPGAADRPQAPALPAKRPVINDQN